MSETRETFPATFTLVARPAGQLVEVALGGAEARILGTSTLTGTAEEILDALPAARTVLCISHGDGSVYGVQDGDGRGLTHLGNLLGLLGYQSLERRFRAEEAVQVSFGFTNLVLATRCVRQGGLALSLGDVVQLLQHGNPKLVTRGQIVPMLIEALKAVSERTCARALGARLVPERLTVGEIFVDLIPRAAEAA